MAITDAGRNLMCQLAVGAGGNAFNNANAHIGVGDSSAAFSAAHTDLQATTNKMRKSMDSTYPSGSSNVLTFRSTFGNSDANFAWNEWGVFNGSAGGTMLNRKVESLGTKTNTQTWQLTVTLTVNTA